MMKQINEAKSMMLVTDVLENGLPRPDGHAQQLREQYADRFFENGRGFSADGIRRQTKETYLIGSSLIFAGKRMCQSTLLSGFSRRKRNVHHSEPPASQALAIVQEGAFLSLWRHIFEIPAGLTEREAVQQAKQEIIDASIQLMIEMKKRN